MRNVRNSAVSLIFLLAFLFNIERLDIDVPNLINIQSYVYILITIAVLAIVLFPEMTKYGFLRGLVAWLFVYAVMKYVFYPENIFALTRGNIYLMIIELSFLGTALFVSFQLAKNIYDIETTINNLMFYEKGENILKLQDATELINSELYRGRRFKLPLSLISFEIDDRSVAMVLSKTIEEMQRRLLNRYAIIHLTQVLKSYVRRGDNVLVDLENQRLYLLSLGTDGKGIKALGEKLQEISQKEMGVNIYSGTATFPDEASTFEGLIQIALDDIHKNINNK